MLARALARRCFAAAAADARPAPASVLESLDVLQGTGVAVEAYTQDGFDVGREVIGSIALYRSGVLSWTPASNTEITPEALAFACVLHPPPELLIIGTGAHPRRVSPEVRSFLRERGIPVESMKSSSATSTYNLLTQEGRRVVAAVLPVGADPEL